MLAVTNVTIYQQAKAEAINNCRKYALFRIAVTALPGKVHGVPSDNRHVRRLPYIVSSYVNAAVFP
jgi:hypothetical protein